MAKGGSINFFLTQGEVNKVSCRRGDSDFTLQEGGSGTLPPPHAHVCVELNLRTNNPESFFRIQCWDDEVRKCVCARGISFFP